MGFRNKQERLEKIRFGLTSHRFLLNGFSNILNDDFVLCKNDRSPNLIPFFNQATYIEQA